MAQQAVAHGVRIGTGPLRIDDDWLGFFFRGDEAAGVATMLRGIAENPTMEYAPQYLRGLAVLLDTSRDTLRAD